MALYDREPAADRERLHGQTTADIHAPAPGAVPAPLPSRVHVRAAARQQGRHIQGQTVRLPPVPLRHDNLQAVLLPGRQVTQDRQTIATTATPALRTITAPPTIRIVPFVTIQEEAAVLKATTRLLQGVRTTGEEADRATQRHAPAEDKDISNTTV